MLSRKLCFSVFTVMFVFLHNWNLVFATDKKTVVVGCKPFAENYILAEIFSQLIESEGYSVNRKFSLAGTMTSFYALRSEEIDVYPEYSGTVAQAILKSDDQEIEAINRRLESQGLKMLKPLGFNNSYSLVMRRSQAQELGITTISDLGDYPKLKGAISFEFEERKDGWVGLQKKYGLKQELINLNVPLNYEALKNSKVDFSEAYTTEPLVATMDFVVLKDDKNFFPKYLAAAFVHLKVDGELVKILNRLSGRIDDEKMQSLTGRLQEGETFASIAQSFLQTEGLVRGEASMSSRSEVDWRSLIEQVRTHLYLTGLAVLLATLIGVPIASLVTSKPRLSRYVLGFTGVLQTIPSIALLTFMIPFFGIGFKPAIIGLFIYSLLPILRNTHTAMTGIDPNLLVAAKGIGLYPFEVFISVKLPLAFPTILAGIRTATILNIGTATLAAFIGAGGLGVPIVTGLALNDSNMVLQGAIPAAILAIIVDSLFGLSERILIRKI